MSDRITFKASANITRLRSSITLPEQCYPTTFAICATPISFPLCVYVCLGPDSNKNQHPNDTPPNDGVTCKEVQTDKDCNGVEVPTEISKVADKAKDKNGSTTHLVVAVLPQSLAVVSA